jgi:tetratricopeptide (TPR) repeat protein
MPNWASRLLLFGGSLLLLANLPALAATTARNLGYLRLQSAVLQADGGFRRVVQYEPPSRGNAAVLKEAGNWFRAALAWAPSDAYAAAGLTHSLIWLGEYKQARDVAAVTLADTGEPYLGLLAGNAYMLAGDHDRAMGAWLGAAATPFEREHLAITLFGQSDWTNYHPERWWDAVEVLTRTLQLAEVSASDRVRLGIRLAMFYQHMGKLEAAEQAARDSLAADPSHPAALAALAWVQLDQGLLDDAYATAVAALAQQPSWQGYFVKGSALLRTCRLDEAIEAFQTGLGFPVTEHRFYWQWLQLGDAYWEAGQPAEALSSWQTFLRYQPNSGSGRDRIEQYGLGTRAREC